MAIIGLGVAHLFFAAVVVAFEPSAPIVAASQFVAGLAEIAVGLWLYRVRGF